MPTILYQDLFQRSNVTFVESLSLLDLGYPFLMVTIGSLSESALVYLLIVLWLAAEPLSTYWVSVTATMINTFCLRRLFLLLKCFPWNRIPENGNQRLTGCTFHTCGQIPFPEDVRVHAAACHRAGKGCICSQSGAGHFP